MSECICKKCGHEFGGREQYVQCPNCHSGKIIPYIPEQPKKPAACPECGHKAHEGKCTFKNSIGHCVCNTPADLQPAEMPLISEPRTNSEDYDEGIRHGSRYQRDADMAWLPTHDQQVASKAVKEFAEKVIEKANQFEYANTEHGIAMIYKGVAKQFITLIRAMAGKE